MTARLDDVAAIEQQMFRYARATDWLETERHRDVFVTDCVFASPHERQKTCTNPPAPTRTYIRCSL